MIVPIRVVRERRSGPFRREGFTWARPTSQFLARSSTSASRRRISRPEERFSSRAGGVVRASGLRGSREHGAGSPDGYFDPLRRGLNGPRPPGPRLAESGSLLPSRETPLTVAPRRPTQRVRRTHSDGKRECPPPTARGSSAGSLGPSGLPAVEVLLVPGDAPVNEVDLVLDLPDSVPLPGI